MRRLLSTFDRTRVVRITSRAVVGWFRWRSDRSGNISAASNTQSLVNLSQKLQDILNNQTKIRKIKYLTHPSKICWDPYVDWLLWKLQLKLTCWKITQKIANLVQLQRAATENREDKHCQHKWMKESTNLEH